MILELYLKNNNSNIRQMHLASGIPETTVRALNKRDLAKWNFGNFEAVAKVLDKDRNTVINELESLASELIEDCNNDLKGRYNLENRRYIGNKNKLTKWIEELIITNTEGNSFFDVFAGTGIVTKTMLDKYDEFVINDFLYSNNVIYKAFMGASTYDSELLTEIAKEYQKLDELCVGDEYFTLNFGGKFFSVNDSKKIGQVRNLIEKNTKINDRERAILLASLIYSADKIANTVGHYDAYRKNVEIKDRFVFELINPVDTSNKKINIYREDANELVKNIYADVTFIDPPYNSRQYSRFYHLLENIVKWEKPVLEGVAMKPPAENMSTYSKSNAPKVFDDLIQNLNTKYIVVTYNNTYLSKSKSSKNKITHDEILSSLNKVCSNKVFEMTFQFFNAGKTNLDNHKEFVFITKVGE